jgi:hypothetical protein
LAAAALALAAGAGAFALWRARQDRLFLVTGPARWIWYTSQIREPAPLRFRAWKDFRLEAAPAGGAAARLFGDRDWTLEVNGTSVESGTQKPGDRLRVLDLAPWLRAGQNRISIEAASPNGVGGVLFWMDLDGGRSFVVSDGTWLVQRLPAGSEPAHMAAVWGRPPMYPWGYPRLP